MSRAVRVAVADSGIHPSHPQVGRVAGGIGMRVTDEGEILRDDAWQDALGHGTAAAATIRGHAPDAALFSVRIFRRRLTARVEALLDAIAWAAEKRMDLLNLSLGCADDRFEDAFADACSRARAAGTLVVAAREMSGTPALPGRLESVVPVLADPDLHEDELRYESGVFYASPWARRLGALSKERNFHGASLAVAHVTGMAAAVLAERPMALDELFEALAAPSGPITDQTQV